MALLEAAEDDVDLQSSLSGKVAREKWLKRRTTIKVKVRNYCRSKPAMIPSIPLCTRVTHCCVLLKEASPTK